MFSALGGAGVLSDDASSIFVAGASTDFFRLDAATGQIKWTDRTGESVFVAEPKLGSSSSNVVYAIEVSVSLFVQILLYILPLICSSTQLFLLNAL